MGAKTYLAGTFLSLLTAVQLQAKTSSTKLASPYAEERSTLTAVVKKSPTFVYGQIRIEGMQYLTAIPEAPQLTYSQFLSARLSALKELGWLEMAGDVSAGTFFARGQSQLVVHEAYMASRGRDFKVFAGRKKKDWSEMDARWQLGLWQPQFAIDALRPEVQGLSGFFADYNTEKMEIMVFATPIYIPSMGPDIREEGGGLVSNSRWYRAPSRNYDFNNRVNTITYNLDIPGTMNLVNNGGAALMGRWGSKDKGPWAVLSAGYLPVNDLILKRKNFKQISDDKVDVTVSPTVTYHMISSLDLGYTHGNIKASLSYLEDRPQEKRPLAHEVDWAIQKLEPIKAYSVATDFTWLDVLSRDLFFQLSYIKVNGGGITDILAEGQPDDFTLFDQRLKFTDAMSFRIEGQLMSIRKRPLVTRLKYLYDYDQQGSLLNTEFLYYPNQTWAFLMGADILGVQNENYNADGFLNQYRANDRIYGGMTYVF